MEIDWERVERIRKEATDNRVLYLTQIIKYQKSVMDQTEKEMKELVTVSPSLVKYAKEITDELKKAIKQMPAPGKNLEQDPRGLL